MAGFSSLQKRAIHTLELIINTLEHKSKKIIENEFNPLNDMRASSQYRTLVSKNLIERFYLEIKNKQSHTIS